VQRRPASRSSNQADETVKNKNSTDEWRPISATDVRLVYLKRLILSVLITQLFSKFICSFIYLVFFRQPWGFHFFLSLFNWFVFINFELNLQRIYQRCRKWDFTKSWASIKH
jgi:hypothetical protein